MKFITWAWEQKLPATEKLVLLALASYTNNTGLCWPSTATLGKVTGLHPQTVSRNLTKLRKRRLITRQRRYNKSNIILLLMTDDQSNLSNNNIIKFNTKIGIDS